MSVTLESLATCFQGLIPAQLFTCSRDGIPNAAYLSHVDYVDATHVALSFQFFNKSRRNIAENPHALVRVHRSRHRPGLAAAAALRAIGDRRARSSIAWRCASRRSRRTAGLKGIFKLLAADIYEVLSIETVEDEGRAPPSQRSDRGARPPTRCSR